MVANIHYRWDFIGLSTDTKPTPENSEKVVDGSTYYCSDTSKLYVFYKDTWYERKALGGGGGGGSSYTAGTGIDITDDTISVDTDTIQEKLTAGTGIDITDNTISATGGGGPTVVQTTGTSTTDVMSQNATTSMVYADPNEKRVIRIGNDSSASNFYTIGIGWNSRASGEGAVALGGGNTTYNSSYAAGDWSVAIGTTAKSEGAESVALGADTTVTGAHSVALGDHAKATQKGQVDISTQRNDTTNTLGYNNSSYRLLTGLYDPQNAHDAATKGYVDGKVLSGAGAPTTATEGTVGQLYEDTTNGKLYQCTAVSGSTYTWAEVGAGGSGGGSSIKALTSADNNYPENNPTGIALWKLEPGIYRKGENGLDIWLCSGSSQSQANQQVDSNWSAYQGLFIVRPGIWNSNPSSSTPDIMAFSSESSSSYAYLQWKIDNSVQDGYYGGTTLRAALEKEFVPLTGSGAPTASSPAVQYVGETYIDTTNQDAYICVQRQTSNNVWKKITP